MTAVTILPDNGHWPPTGYLAVAGKVQGAGRTAGEALDALTAQLNEAESGTLLVVQHLRPDNFFTAVQQQRLAELMKRWRTKRDAGTALTSQEQAELDSLVEDELRAATARAAALASKLGS